jgi:DNA-binding helix-hairpin-helix protein with protein kinase domain
MIRRPPRSLAFRLLLSAWTGKLHFNASTALGNSAIRPSSAKLNTWPSALDLAMKALELCADSAVRFLFNALHQGAVAGNIGTEDRDQPAF